MNSGVDPGEGDGGGEGEDGGARGGGGRGSSQRAGEAPAPPGGEDAEAAEEHSNHAEVLAGGVEAEQRKMRGCGVA